MSWAYNYRPTTSTCSTWHRDLPMSNSSAGRLSLQLDWSSFPIWPLSQSSQSRHWNESCTLTRWKRSRRKPLKTSRRDRNNASSWWILYLKTSKRKKLMLRVSLSLKKKKRRLDSKFSKSNTTDLDSLNHSKEIEISLQLIPRSTATFFREPKLLYLNTSQDRE